MSWRDSLKRVELADGRQLIGASFRGVPFFVESSNRSGGRRAQVHEFPLSDYPFVEDLGRRARTFSVDGYVLGADYVAQRDKLLAALEDVDQPGELIHPYYGFLRAVCTSLTTRESIADGGMARFAIEFAEAPLQMVAVTEQADVAEQLFLSADAALTATQAELEDGFDVEGLPSFALESASQALAALAEGLGEALAPLVGSTQELAKLDLDIQGLTTDAASLVREPAAVLGVFRGAISGLAETLVSSPAKVLRALLDTYTVEVGPGPIVTTSTREQERDNLAALAAALRRVLAIEAARLAAQATWDSHEEATEVRDEIAGLLEEQAELAGDAAYPGLVQLRADLIRAVPGEAVLARILTVERRTTVPSLLLAYQLYGSVAEEADILARNRIRHPAFIAGTLKVLSSA